MTGEEPPLPAGGTPEHDATLAAALLAVDPGGLGGACVRAGAGPLRERWLALLRELLPASLPLRRVPLGVADSRLLGGLDLAATLKAGRVVAERGLLAEADGGLVVLPMAERIGAAVAARVTAAMDTGCVVVAREGVGTRYATRFGVVVLDESGDDEEGPPAALRDRVALHLDFTHLRAGRSLLSAVGAAQVAAARDLLPEVECDDVVAASLCEAALALGIDSVRAPLLALRAARALAALDGRDAVEEEDVVAAARMVLGPRATRMPAPPEPETPEEAPPESAAQQPPEQPPPDRDESHAEPVPEDQPLVDQVLAACAAALQAGLLEKLRARAIAAKGAAAAGRAGALKRSGRRGRPAGVRRGEPRAGTRLHVLATLRAAAPWQGLRRRERERHGGARPRIEVRREDFHVAIYKQPSESTAIFVVDASGSSALHRLSEAKGAVELLLADCYVRRDSVAVIAFRGRSAELLLPPTRSLVRAKRSLAMLPGGGGTPLASGLDAAAALAQSVARRGGTPVVVVLTDGRANIARDGAADRARAGADALASARLVRQGGYAALMIDTSPQAQPRARELADGMGATYLPLPYAGAAALSAAVLASGLMGTP